MKVNISILLLVIISFTNAIYSKTFYVAPDGNINAAGTQIDPIGWKYFQARLDRIKGGHIFIFKPGYYNGAIILGFEHSGSEGKPTILKSEIKYKAILNGSPEHIIHANGRCKWIIIDGFDISGAFLAGIKVSGDYSVIRNCHIHNNGLQGIEAHNINNSVIENNLIEYNGQHPRFDHGIYADGNNIVIRNNVVRGNSSCGLSMGPEITGSQIENNLIQGNDGWAINLCSAGKGKNRLVNNTLVENSLGIVIGDGSDDLVVNNIIWHNGTQTPIQTRPGSSLKKVTVEYNIITPLMTIGEHNFSDDPHFLNVEKGLFYLLPDSPAIGKGFTKYKPSQDFFSRPLKLDKAPDIGCFQYNAVLLLPEVRKNWFKEWAFWGTPTLATPDLWALPKDANVSQAVTETN